MLFIFILMVVCALPVTTKAAHGKQLGAETSDNPDGAGPRGFPGEARNLRGCSRRRMALWLRFAASLCRLQPVFFLFSLVPHYHNNAGGHDTHHISDDP